MQPHKITITIAVFVALLASRSSGAQTPSSGAAQTPPGSRAHVTAVAAVTGVTPPADYVIGPADQLSIVFWRDKDLSADVTVRPDGKISLPLLNEVQAAGYTPEQLRARLVEAASKYVEEPNATVVVKEINSRNAFITGNVLKPGPYPVSANMTVLQMIALAGGLQEYADDKNIVIIRIESGNTQYHNFNYRDVVKRRRIEQNIVLRPGDTVVVP
jgi:polysaccharide export outer membrane protein